MCLVFEVANLIGVVPACICMRMHAGTTPIRLATSKTRHIVLPEDGPIGLKHIGVNDEIL